MMIKRLLVLILLIPVLHFPYKVMAAEACGTPLPPSYKGIAAFANGDDTNTGKSCAGRGTYGLLYQCVEYVKRFYAQALSMDVSRWNYDAYDFYDAASNLGLVRFPNNGTSAPQPDDIIVFRGGEYGHVAIVTQVSSNSVTVIEQNWGNDSVGVLPMTVSGGRYNVQRGGGSLYRVVGWLRKSQPNARIITITAEPTPLGSNFGASNFSIVYEDSSGDGLFQVDELVSFSGVTFVRTDGVVLEVMKPDIVLGSPNIPGISSESGNGFGAGYWTFETLESIYPNQDPGDPVGWEIGLWQYTE